MTKKAAMGFLTSPLAGHQKGGVALIFLVILTTLAVPMSIAAVKVADQMALNSRVWEVGLSGNYSAVSGIEAAIAQIQIDPNFAGAISLDIDGDGVYDFTNTVIKRPVTTVEALADIVLALDNSGSINTEESTLFKMAANDMVDGFSMSTAEGRVRVGVTRFANSGGPVVGMTDVDVHPTGTPVHDGIDGLFPGIEKTNIVNGILSAQNQFSTGLGDREAVPNIIIFFTDGNDNPSSGEVGNDTSDIAAASAGSGAEVFAVGVGTGDQVSPATLFAIAFDPDDPSAVFDSGNPDPYYSDHVFQADDFTGLIDLASAIVAAVQEAAGIIYDIESVPVSGDIIRSRVLITPDGQVKILSWEGN